MKNFLLLFFAVISLAGKAQTLNKYPFAEEIANFKKNDSISFSAKNTILFVGSSSFRKWINVQQAFPQYPIINRGFGGSTIPDVTHYANDIIFPYQAKQIVIYCGENDIASSDTITAGTMLKRFQQLYFLIRSKQKSVEIDFISIKPSPSRIKFRPVMEESNRLIKAFISTQQHAKFVNVFNAMLNKDGSIIQEIFTEDNLHMNNKGYAIWTKIIEPYLLK